MGNPFKLQDGLGFPERMWVDPEEDGLNGNEHLN
jgi:hypothetical protein